MELTGQTLYKWPFCPLWSQTLLGIVSAFERTINRTGNCSASIAFNSRYVLLHFLRLPRIFFNISWLDHACLDTSIPINLSNLKNNFQAHSFCWQIQSLRLYILYLLVSELKNFFFFVCLWRNLYNTHSFKSNLAKNCWQIISCFYFFYISLYRNQINNLVTTRKSTKFDFEKWNSGTNSVVNENRNRTNPANIQRKSRTRHV